MTHRGRRVVGVLCIAVAAGIWIWQNQQHAPTTTPSEPKSDTAVQRPLPNQPVPQKALDVLALIAIKGRAPKTGYERTQFGDGWMLVGSCDMRNVILHRDLSDTLVDSNCKVTSGVLNDPYTGSQVIFTRGANTSDDVQIDHVVALSNAWQTGAQLLSLEERRQMANDPLELLAVDGNANQAKGDGDAATWLPANKAFRCQYIARQIAVKYKYRLWVTDPEKSAMMRVLESCPEQLVPNVTG